jgi:hypothetical protein
VKSILKYFDEDQVQIKSGFDCAHLVGVSLNLSAGKDGFHFSDDMIMGFGTCTYYGAEVSWVAPRNEGVPAISLSIMGGKQYVLGASFDIGVENREIDLSYLGTVNIPVPYLSSFHLFLGRGDGFCGKIELSGASTMIGIDSDWNLKNINFRGWFSEPVLSD